MTAPNISIDELEKGMALYRDGKRPWIEKKPDWYIQSTTGELFPLKYTYGLSLNLKPAIYTTNQIKESLKSLNLLFVSISAQESDSINFDLEVLKSLKDSQKRKERLRSSNDIPSKKTTLQLAYVRNPDVVAGRLELAKGKCEKCQSKAPFVKKSNGLPYLEVHHIIPLSKNGLDKVKNTTALCPNCHREIHFG